MIGPIPPATRTLLAKCAYDNGFDLERTASSEWMAFGSTRSPLGVWLGWVGDDGMVAAFSRRDVGKALAQHGPSFAGPLPEGAQIARIVPDVLSVHRLLRRAFQLSRALPDELLTQFQKMTASYPKATEAERLVVQRVGQDLFRAGLVDYWEGRCAMTGLAVVELLRASHIKPWADCATDAERLDVFNGLLLAPHLDAAFDRGLVTVSDEGSVVVSDLLGDEARRVLSLDAPLRVLRLEETHRAYLVWHREKVFRNGLAPAGG